MSPRAAWRLEHLGFTDVAERIDDSGLCVVVSPRRIVVGVLEARALADHRHRRAEDVAALGPTTVRPSEERRALEERMAADDVDRVVVTDPGGHLLGVVSSDSRHGGLHSHWANSCVNNYSTAGGAEMFPVTPAG